MLHIRELPREGRLVGEDAERLLVVVEVVVELHALLHELDREAFPRLVAHDKVDAARAHRLWRPQVDGAIREGGLDLRGGSKLAERPVAEVVQH